jgi:rhodanese-related sulfurtransferase
VYLDVRRKDEIEQEPLIEKHVLHAVCTLTDCTDLVHKINEAAYSQKKTLNNHEDNNPMDETNGTSFQALLDKKTPIIVFCRSGRRSGKAKEELEGMGYHAVLNAGGVGELRASLAKAAAS